MMKKLPLVMLLFMAAFLLLAVPSVAFAGAWQDGGPVPESDYWTLIETAWTQVNQAKVSPSSNTDKALQNLAERLDAIHQVTLEDGQTVPVDNSDLVKALSQPNPDLAWLLDRLGALRMAGRAWAHPQSDPTAPDRLDRVFQRPEFQAQVEPPPSPLAELWLRFIEWLLRQLDRTGILNARLPGANWIVVGLAVLLVGGVAVYFIRSVRAKLASDEGLEDLDSPRMSSAAAIQQAQQMAAGSDYRSAVRYLYLAAALVLDERGLLRFDKALTNREVLRQASTNEFLREQLAPVVETFDKVWYGYEPISEDEYRAYAEQIARAREVKPE